MDQLDAGRRAAALLRGAGVARLKQVAATSAGGIVIRFADGAPHLVVGKRKRERDGVTWTLPKGTPDPHETTEETALREVREETGVTGRIVAPLPGIEYWFFDRGSRIHKQVDYFLLEYVSGDPADFDASEFSGAGWFSWDAGIARMTFENERRVVVRARDLLEKNGL